MPTALPAYDAARLASDLLDLLPQTATILRATYAPDGFGGRTPTWSAVATVPCRLGAAAFRESDKDVDERFRNMQLFRVSFVVGTDVRITDRIEVDGLLLSVEGVHFPKSIEIERIVICVEATS
jgi:hypothetical protein